MSDIITLNITSKEYDLPINIFEKVQVPWKKTTIVFSF